MDERWRHRPLPGVAIRILFRSKGFQLSTLSEVIQNRDMTSIAPLLADDVVFNSPIAHRAYVGNAQATPALVAAVCALDKISHVRKVAGNNENEYLLLYRGTSLSTEIVCCLVVHLNAHKKIDRLVLFVRPLRAITRLAEAVGNSEND